MRLWTMQPLEFYKLFEQTKVMRANKEYIEWLEEKGFHKAYDWLVEQMIWRIGKPPKGVEYPIWAWHTHEWKHKKPDLRRAEYGHRGERMACVEFDIAPERALLSDHNYWHIVLNDSYFGSMLEF